MDINRDVNRSAPAVATAEIYIEAPRSLVWLVHTDFARWPHWNPDVGKMDVRGPLSVGTQFRWKSKGTPITSTLQEIRPEQVIVWTGRAPLGIRAVHVWQFESEGNGTRVRTEESFEGAIVRIFPGLMRAMLKAALDKGLASLKTEAERRAFADAT